MPEFFTGSWKLVGFFFFIFNWRKNSLIYFIPTAHFVSQKNGMNGMVPLRVTSLQKLNFTAKMLILLSVNPCLVKAKIILKFFRWIVSMTQKQKRNNSFWKAAEDLENGGRVSSRKLSHSSSLFSIRKLPVLRNTLTNITHWTMKILSETFHAGSSTAKSSLMILDWASTRSVYVWLASLNKIIFSDFGGAW